MPHVIDPDTGLCVICRKGDIAAIKEGRKFKRDHYDIRKAEVERVTNKNDPNYHVITDRHYVTYDDQLSPRRNYNASRGSKSLSKSPFTSRQSVLEFPDFDSEDEEVKRIEANSRRSKLSIVPSNSLRKASLLKIKNSEPNIVYVTSNAEKSPKYAILNDNTYGADAPVYVDYEDNDDYTMTSVIHTPRKKKVIVHHHFDEADGDYSVAQAEENPRYHYEYPPSNEVIYYKYKK